MVVVLPPRTTMLDLAGPLEVLRRANFEQNAIAFRVRYVGASPSISTSIGIDLAHIEPLPAHLPDGTVAIVVGNVDCASDWGRPTDYEADEQDRAALVCWLRGNICAAHTVIAISSGAVLLARAVLLDGRRYTRITSIAHSCRVLHRRPTSSQIGSIYGMETSTPRLALRWRRPDALVYQSPHRACVRCRRCSIPRNMKHTGRGNRQDSGPSRAELTVTRGNGRTPSE